MVKKHIIVLGMVMSLIFSGINVSGKVIGTEASEKDVYSISELLNSDKGQEASTLAEKWIADGQEFDYPVKPESEEWKVLDTHEKMVEVCTIPDEVIQQMSTYELLEIVMDYPLLSDLYCYNTYEQGLYALVSEFNGLRELLKRSDGISEILEYYENYKIPKNPATPEKVIEELKDVNDYEFDEKLTEVIGNNEESTALQMDFRTIANVELAELLLVNNSIYVSCDEEQKSNIVDIISDKYNDKLQSNLFTGKENLVYEAAEEAGNTDNIYSYNGDTWAKALDAEIKKEYPDATLIRSSDNRYNCHSYAWYKQSTGNVYWMNNPSKYISDGSYKKVTNKNNRGSGNRVVWIQNNSYIHSGYLVSINSNGSYNIRSKWGSAPLMLHKANYSPYDAQTREYYER